MTAYDEDRDDKYTMRDTFEALHENYCSSGDGGTTTDATMTVTDIKNGRVEVSDMNVKTGDTVTIAPKRAMLLTA